MRRAEVLDAAKTAVTGDRHTAYGKPEDNFDRIAARWNVHLENIGYGVTNGVFGFRSLTGTDVATMCIDIKLARLENDPRHADSWVDIAGYAACGAEASGAKQPADEDTLAREVVTEQWGFEVDDEVRVNGKAIAFVNQFVNQYGVVEGFDEECVIVRMNGSGELLFWQPHFLDHIA